MTELKFANYYGYSDITPYEIVKVISDKTIEVRRMEYTINPNFKCKTVIGGFCGNTVNQDEQSYTYESDEDESIMRIRFSKAKNGWYSACGQRHLLENKPVRFYDYNF